MKRKIQKQDTPQEIANKLFKRFLPIVKGNGLRAWNNARKAASMFASDMVQMLDGEHADKYRKVLIEIEKI